MKTVALVYIGNIEICPYIKAYLSILDERKIEYNVIFWEREKLVDNYPDNYLPFQYKSNPSKKKYKKIFDFVQYFFWLRKVLWKNKYKTIICLDTLTAILVYFCGVKKSKIGIEIRDYAYEDIGLFKYFEKRMFAKADKIFISSKAFLSFLPNGFNYIQTHNISAQESLLEQDFQNKSFDNNKSVYKVVYVGSLKYFECQKSIVSQLANDARFLIEYHGYGPDYKRFVQFCEEKCINNISITGLYTEEEKVKFYEGADFIINCYDKNEGSEVMYAISNKYYDGLIYHIPQIVERGTFKGMQVVETNIGIEWDTENDSDLSGIMLDYLSSLDVDAFNKECHKQLVRCTSEYDIYIKEIKELFEEQ